MRLKNKIANNDRYHPKEGLSFVRFEFTRKGDFFRAEGGLFY